MKQKQKKDTQDINSSRRKFIQKVAWSTPTLIVLGQIVTPSTVYADASGGPDDPPDWNF